MSILDALKTFKQERESIDDVAALPQALIMQMAQKGQIPKTDVPMILARKAEIAQTQAQMNALRQKQMGGVAPTIMEQMIAANAQQEVPQELTDVGIASNPVPEMRMAGGGIVAFENGGGVSDRWKALGNDTTPYLAEDFRRDAAEFFDPIVGFLTNREGRQRQAARELKKAQSIQTADQPGDFPMYTPRPVKANATALADPTMGERTNAPSGNKPAGAAAAMPTDPYAELKSMFREQAAERAKERSDAKNMALLQTGLNIMSGTSPYALSNIGEGGAKGARGYQEAMADIRKSEREGRRDYADVVKSQIDYGQKERQLDIQKMAATRPGETMQIIQNYAKTKGVPFDKAVEEVFGAKKTDPFMQMILQNSMGKDGKLDRNSLAKNIESWQSTYGITPTR